MCVAANAIDLKQHPSGIVPVLQYATTRRALSALAGINHASCLFAVFVLNRNVVSTVNLGVKLNLKDIAMNARNAEYNPKVAHSPSPSLPLCFEPPAHSMMRLQLTTFYTSCESTRIMHSINSFH